MGDLVVTEADMHALGGALTAVLDDLQALQGALLRMDAACVGAAPLLESQRTFTDTRRGDLTALGKGIADRHGEVEQVAPTLRTTDHRLAGDAQRRTD
ncbi:hypothetical protein [Actinacidiphila rubida]|uniref:Uncharacterized protein n=1 Tax=Actinacidiphila rubida TaxID=310780 RepID=A0A1H8EXY8_9ACTN|nr:hypothetical protein [Actinacidiphila rubida]SEN24319.1 hypothetical protein SAMN05216267_100330 [Actinacidiphila rubida]